MLTRTIGKTSQERGVSWLLENGDKIEGTTKAKLILSQEPFHSCLSTQNIPNDLKSSAPGVNVSLGSCPGWLLCGKHHEENQLVEEKVFTWLSRPSTEGGGAGNYAGAEAGPMNECYLLAYSPGLAQPAFYQPGPPGPAVALPTANWALSHQPPTQKMLRRHAVPTSRSEDNPQMRSPLPPQIHLDCLKWTETNHPVNSTGLQISMANTRHSSTT